MSQRLGTGGKEGEEGEEWQGSILSHSQVTDFISWQYSSKSSKSGSPNKQASLCRVTFVIFQ